MPASNANRLRFMRTLAKRPSSLVVLAWSAADSTDWVALVRDGYARAVTDGDGEILELTPLGVAYLGQLERAVKPNGGAS